MTRLAHPSAAAILALLGGSPRALAERCAPRAQVTGEDSVVPLVAAELRRLGVAVGEATAACPSVEAAVRGDGQGGFAVTLRDGRRSEDRDLGSPAVAAAWIDAWLRDDLDWRGEPAPPGTAPSRVATEGAALSSERLVARGRPSSASDGLLARASVAAGYEQTWSGDGSAWSGVGVAACGHRGPWCLGGRARFATQSFATGQTGVARDDLSALATVAYTVAAGRAAIAPELGLGVGRMSSGRRERCAPAAPLCDPHDPGCHPPPAHCMDGDGTFVGDDLRAATLTPRAAAAVRASVPLFEHVWLEGIASVEVAPFGHHSPFAATRGAPGDESPASIALPGEPVTSFQLGLGLRVGMP